MWYNYLEDTEKGVKSAKNCEGQTKVGLWMFLRFQLALSDACVNKIKRG